MVKNKKAGFISAGVVAIGQGFEGVLFQFLFLFFAAAVVQNNAFGTAVMAIKETIGILISLIVFGPSLFISVIKRLREKQAWYFIAASVLGTSMGNVFYIFAVAQAGSSYGVILTALYPIFSMLLIKFTLKEKENWKVWTGLSITVISGLLFLLLPTLLDSSSGGFGGKRFLGMVLGLMAALFWALEGVLLKIGMNIKSPKKAKSFTSKEIVVTRSIFTGASTYIILMPLMMIFGNTFKFYGDIFSDYRTLMITAAISVNIFILRLLHTYALKTIGPKLTATIDTNNFLVPTIFAEFFQFLNLRNSEHELLFQPVVWWAYFLIIPIAIGVGIVVYFNKEQQPEVVFEKPLE